jgi:hypothetical protein
LAKRDQRSHKAAWEFPKGRGLMGVKFKGSGFPRICSELRGSLFGTGWKLLDWLRKNAAGLKPLLAGLYPIAHLFLTKGRQCATG